MFSECIKPPYIYLVFYFLFVNMVQMSVSFVEANDYTSQTQNNGLFAPKNKKA